MRFATIVLGAACATLVGCAATASPDWDAVAGDRLRMLHAQQTIDPQAAARNGQTTPAADGRTAREAADHHVQTYRNPPPSNVIQIGVTGGGGR